MGQTLEIFSGGTYSAGGREFQLPNTGEGKAKNAFSVPAFQYGVRFISQSLAGLPKYLLKKVDGKRVKQEHPVLPIVSDYPNELVTAFDLWEYTILNAIVYGNGYVLIDRKGREVTGLYALHPVTVTPFRRDKGQFYRIVGYDDQNRKLEQEVPGTSMIHIKGLSTDGERGVSILDTLAQTLQLPLSLDLMLNNYFEKGAAVNMVVESAKPLDSDDVQTLKDGIGRYHSGVDNSWKVMILSEATAKNLTVPLKEFALDVIKKASVTDISYALGLPTHVLLGGAGASREQQDTELVKYVFTSWVNKIEQELNRKLLTKEEIAQKLFFKWDLAGLQKGDFVNRRNVLRADYMAGLLSWERWCELEDEDASRDGTFFEPLHLGVSADSGATTDQSGGAATATDVSGAPGGVTTTDTPTDPTVAPIESQEPTGDPLDGGQPFSRAKVEGLYGRFLSDAAERVKRKQVKAFQNAEKKDDGARAEWLKKFSGEQGVYLGEALEPFLATVLTDSTELSFALQDVVEGYSNLVLTDGEEADPQIIINKVIEKRIK